MGLFSINRMGSALLRKKWGTAAVIGKLRTPLVHPKYQQCLNNRMETEHPNNLFVLVDGSSYLYRAFHALPSLTNARGEPTGAVFGVANMLKKLVNETQPAYASVVFDAPGKTFRDEMYPQYKANRPPMPDELREQIAPLHELIKAMGWPLVQVEGVEADDVIGTLALQAEKQGLQVLISTGDKDMAQLVTERITLVNTMDSSQLDRQGVEKKFGVTPKQIVDYLALMGDKTDNIPGVPGVGPKTAAKWLAAYGSVDELIANAAEIKGKIGEKLRTAIEALPLSYQLATIKCDVKLNEQPEQLYLRSADSARLRELLENLDFRRWRAELNETGSSGAPKSKQTVKYDLILDEEAMDLWLQRLETAALIAFDTETTSINYMDAEVVGMSFAVTDNEAAYLPFAHDYPNASKQLSRQRVFAAFKPLLENPNIKKVGQNLKYDQNVLINHGIFLQGIAHDTMLESYVLNSTANRHDLDTLCEKYLNHTNIHFEDVAGKGAKQLTFNQVPLDQAGPYAAEDADMTLRLHHHFWPQLKALSAQRDLYETVEVPLVPVLSRMERNGVLVDADLLLEQSQELMESMLAMEREVFDLAGESFNLGSPKQLQSILFDKLGLPVVRKTPKGQASTAEDVLQELAADYPLPRVILDYRSLSKLKSTYTDKLPLLINSRSGRIHTSYQQAVASTGRLSSSDPNLQNIPIRTAEGRRIRQAFIAPSGYRILAADYSQIELRIMAHLSRDQGLLEAFHRGQDVHRATAAEVFGGSSEDVSTKQRRTAKAINFGLIYGMSAFGLARQLGIGRPAAQAYIDRYFERYPGVKRYMDTTRKEARERGFVETLFGRRLYLQEINSRNAQRRQYAERTAINAPMQGTAADIIKKAMISVDQWLLSTHHKVRMIMQVHDELVFEVDQDAVEAVRTKIVHLMTKASELAVPLEVDANTGLNWDEAH